MSASWHSSMPADSKNLLEQSSRCVACGLCVPQCPTYRKTLSEADSPRGRILMMEGVLQGKIPANARLRQHLDLCLTCRQCERVCPNHVRYGELVYQMRARIRKPLFRRLIEKSVLFMVKHTRLLCLALWFGSRSRFFWAKLPFFRRFAAYRPPIEFSSFDSFYPAIQPKAEVMLFLGCIARAADVQTLKSTIALLQTHGFSVYVPSAQRCCGALHRHLGDAKGAKKLGLQNIAAFPGHLPILTVASGCAANLLDYETFLGTPEAALFAHRIHDAFDYLLPYLEPWRDQKKVAYHLPCTMQNVLRIDPFASFFKGIKPLEGNDQCCGGAGSYMIAEPEMANRLLDDKIASIRQSGAEVVLTANIGCMLHLQKGIEKAGLPTRLMHPLVFLDQNTR